MQLKRKRKNQEIETVLEQAALGEAQRLGARRVELLKDFISKETLEYLYIRYTINANAPFSQVEHSDFRTMLQYINPAANNLLPNSHNIIRSRVMDLFTEDKRRVSIRLQAALFSIHIRQISPDYPNTPVNICHRPYLSPDYPGGVNYLLTTPDGVVGR